MNLFFCVSFLVPVHCYFNPFSDSDLFSINWAGPIDAEKLGKDGDREMVSIQTDTHEKYECVIPESQAEIDATRKANYNGATPDELMEALLSQTACSYRIESYWTYELCHGKHIKQYHENKELGLQKQKMQEFYLGRAAKPQTKEADASSETKDEEEGEKSETETKEKPAIPQVPQEIKSLKIDGLDLPYYAINMTDGTECDLTGKSRRSHVMYVCQPNGRGEIYLLKETSSCEYDIVVLTQVLCSHPMFKPKDPPVSKINCHSIDGSPWRPTRLTQLEQSDKMEEEEEEEEEEDLPIKTPPPASKPPPTRPDTTIGKTADKQLLRDFLSGDYCLHGGGGWWKHEFCYKKYAKQYHEETDSVTNIFLGNWDKQEHLDWLQRIPGKRPKPVGERKFISQLYTSGDICDLTNKPRFVEVKLKCANKPDTPHAVSIYLVEPKPCEYILAVESPILCDLIDAADENGLFDNYEV